MDNWLSQVIEAPLDPDLPICDPHHHLWNGPGDRGRYLVEDYLADAGSDHRIVSTVFIECGTMYRNNGPISLRPLGETEFARDAGSRPAEGRRGPVDIAAGIVGFADLTMGYEVSSLLEKHITAGAGQLRGIRQVATWDSDPAIPSMGFSRDMIRSEKFREGFSCLKKFGLSFDAWQYYTQLLDLADLARAFPETTIIVNHVGGPLGIGRHAGKDHDVFREWKRGMGELGNCPNVMVKLGGLGMPRTGFEWHMQTRPPDSASLAKKMTPYFHFCIETFGADRCMFESNFPVDKTSFSYTILWNAFKRICAHGSPDERNALFHDTATRVYRLTQRDVS